MNRSIRVLIFSALLHTIGILSDANAQIPHWTKMDSSWHGTAEGRFNTYASEGAGRTPYFINAKIGFVYGIPSGQGSSLFRTTDSGWNWKTYPYSKFSGGIHALYFTSVSHGFLAAVNYNVGNSDSGVYETFDTGSTWRKISPDSMGAFSWI